MQVFRLVKGGFPDRVIAFDTLPKEYLRTLKLNPPAGLGRHWSNWLKENGSVDDKGQPGFYILDYILTNNDKQAWENIANYTRRVVDTKFRLTDRLEDMAKPLARDSRSEITLEPEDVTVIPIPPENVDDDQEDKPIEEDGEPRAADQFAPIPVVRKGRKAKES